MFKRANTVVLRKLKKNDYTNLKAYKLIALLNTIETGSKISSGKKVNRRCEGEPPVIRVLNKREARTLYRDGAKTFNRASAHYIEHRN